MAKHGRRTPAKPEAGLERSDRVLAVLGVSPAVLTEFLWWLGAIGKAHIDGIEVWTTKKGVEAARALVAAHWEPLRRSVSSKDGWLPAEQTAIDYRCFSADADELEDIRTDEDARLVLQQLCERVREIRRNVGPGVVLHALISGGRKTMGAALQTAVSLFGDGADSVYHVLVHPAIEKDPETVRTFVFPKGPVSVLDGEGRRILVPENEQVSVHRQPVPLIRPLIPMAAYNLVVDELVRNVNLRVREIAEVADFHWDVTGSSPAIAELRQLVERIAPSDATILIRGETGTGKELVARALHENSKRCRGPFVAINCAALPDTLVEGELFGWEKGAFTDAAEMRRGAFEQADGGTLFLDEVGELRTDVQAKLLRALQERKIRRLGSRSPAEVEVDVRVVAATNVDLEAAVREKRFREDLYYRLPISVRVPALRERNGDLMPLLESLAGKHAPGRHLEFASEAIGKLMAFPWPGNVRELEGVVEYAVAFAGNGATRIEAEHLPDKVRGAVLPAADAVVDTGVEASQAAGLAKTYARQLEAILLSVAAASRTGGKLNMTGVVNALIGGPAGAGLTTDAAKKRLAAYLGFSPHVAEHFEGLDDTNDARILYDWAMSTRVRKRPSPSRPAGAPRRPPGTKCQGRRA